MDNWNEEQFLVEAKMKEYMARKSGSAASQKDVDPLAYSLQEVPLSRSADGAVHIGDTIMLLALANQAALSCDYTEKLAGVEEESCAVSTSAITQASVARNSFVVEDASGRAQPGDQLLFNQHIRLRVHPSLSATPLYLHSRLFSIAKYSKQQTVGMVATTSFDTVWTVQTRDANTRYETQGFPVPAGAEIVLIHAASNRALTSDKTIYHNRFGSEREVFASAAAALHTRPQVLQKERTVGRTVDQALKVEDPHQVFVFIGGASDAQSSAAARD